MTSAKKTSAKKIEANRRNARASTGPTSAAGRMRSARNALRHGLNVPLSLIPGWPEQIRSLAAAIAQDETAPELNLLAHRVAEAHLSVVRARAARHDFIVSRLEQHDFAALGSNSLFEKIDRYERRALSRRKAAIRQYDQARLRLFKKQDATIC